MTNLTKVFHTPIFIEKTKQKAKNRSYLCKYQCFCDKKFIAEPYLVQIGRIKSCGCLRKHLPVGNVTHGLCKHNKRLYKIWTAMRGRCYNPNNENFNRYGGRGIHICKKWHDFKNFHQWAINNGYTDKLTIERNNVNKGYCPSNCKWIPKSEQCWNTSKNMSIQKAREIGRLLSQGIPPKNIAIRLDVGVRSVRSIRRKDTFKIVK
jgi:hypothetical protein